MEVWFNVGSMLPISKHLGPLLWFQGIYYDDINSYGSSMLGWGQPGSMLGWSVELKTNTGPSS